MTTFSKKYYRFLLYGGPDGEMGASMRYLSQRYSMPYGEQKAVLTDIGTEELAHLEIVAAIVHQLTRNLTAEELEEQGFGPYYIDHATGIWPQAAGGVPFNACEFQSKGDPVTDLFEDLAAEQKARLTSANHAKVIIAVPAGNGIIADGLQGLDGGEFGLLTAHPEAGNGALRRDLQ